MRAIVNFTRDFWRMMRGLPLTPTREDLSETGRMLFDELTAKNSGIRVFTNTPDWQGNCDDGE